MNQSDIKGFLYITIKSFTQGSVVVDSSIVFSQTQPSNLIQTALVNQASLSNNLNVVPSSISVTETSSRSNSNSNSQWWLPLAIVLPIAFVVTVFVGLIAKHKIKV